MGGSPVGSALRADRDGIHSPTDADGRRRSGVPTTWRQFAEGFAQGQQPIESALPAFPNATISG